MTRRLSRRPSLLDETIATDVKAWPVRRELRGTTSRWRRDATKRVLFRVESRKKGRRVIRAESRLDGTGGGHVWLVQLACSLQLGTTVHRRSAEQAKGRDRGRHFLVRSVIRDATSPSRVLAVRSSAVLGSRRFDLDRIDAHREAGRCRVRRARDRWQRGCPETEGSAAAAAVGDQ